MKWSLLTNKLYIILLGSHWHEGLATEFSVQTLRRERSGATVSRSESPAEVMKNYTVDWTFIP